MRREVGEQLEDRLTGLRWLEWRMLQSNAWEKEGERFIQKSLNDSVILDQQLTFPYDLFSCQNWGTGRRCPLSAFLKGLPTAYPVEMCG